MKDWAGNSLFCRMSYALLMVTSVPDLATSCNRQNLDAAQSQIGEGAKSSPTGEALLRCKT